MSDLATDYRFFLAIGGAFIAGASIGQIALIWLHDGIIGGAIVDSCFIDGAIAIWSPIPTSSSRVLIRRLVPRVGPGGGPSPTPVTGRLDRDSPMETAALSRRRSDCGPMSDRGWFDGLEPDDVDGAAARISEGTSDTPADWPAMATEAGFVDGEDTYHDRLREAALAAFEAELEAISGTADRELVQLVRTLDATTTTEHELRQQVAEAIGEATGAPTPATDVASLSDALADTEGSLEPMRGLVAVLDDLDAERSTLEAAVDTRARAVAPNLSALAGAVLAARLIAAAGSLESLARTSSSTMQLLGAESALFAHLRGDAPSPKHGLIYTHPAVRSAPAGSRGKVARVLAGKLTIAARVDHYRGEIEPSLAADLEERLESILGGGSG